MINAGTAAVEVLEDGWTGGKVEEMIQKNWLCDITKARTLLGFEPRISLARGAELAVAWYKKVNWL